MALTVGELNGIISIDDRAVNPALRRTENALRAAANQMGDDATRAGQQAGQQLGQGLVRGADGQWRNMRGELVDAVTAAAAEAEAAAHRAGQRAGQQLGDGLTDGATAGADDAVEATESKLDKLKTAALGVGLAAGAVLVDAFGQAMEQSQITGKLGASMGKTPAEAQRYGQIAGKLYADAVTEDFQGAADVIGAVMAAGLVPPGATNAQIQSIAANLHDLSDTFELDLGQAANAVGQIMKTGLAPNAKTAMDVMTRGMQVMGPRADDLADTFNEYSTIFRQLGISAGDATGILAQGMAAGARDTDVVADSLKELVLITQKGGKATDSAFKKIGLSGKDMQAAFSKGGPEAKKGLDQIFDGLRKVKNPADRAQLAVTLFGTKAEDMQKALFAIDPSKAVDSLGQVGGAADRMGNAIRDNAAVQVEQFKRRAMQSIVNVMGTYVIPALLKLPGVAQQVGSAFQSMGSFIADNKVTFIAIGSVITAILLPSLVRMAATATTTAATTVAAWAAQGVSALTTAATYVGVNALIIAGWVRQGAAAVLAGARVVATWLLMAVSSMASAVQMAAAWVVAMGPVGWVIAAIVGLAALVIANWDAVKRYTGIAWNFVAAVVRAAVTATVSWIMGLAAIPGMVTGYFGRMKDGAIRKAYELVAWVRGLPGRINGAMSGMGTLLVAKGRNVVEGLWAGIQGMGPWIYSKLVGWAKSMIPGPIAKALGIASPSKVTKAQGRWIARGLIDGLTGSSKQVRAASMKLADIVRDSVNPRTKRSKALSTISSTTKKLVSLASAQQRVATRLKTAQKTLSTKLAARTKLAADVSKGVLDAANITAQTGSEGDSAESILDGLRSNRKAAERFAADLAKLRAKGVSSDLIAQIAQAGVAQGSSAAASLARASTGQIKQINSEQAGLVKAANAAGSTAGTAMYGAGIQAAQGLVRGLQSQQKLIDRQMLTIARSMSKSIRKALGIKSPSRVMAAVGAYTAEGLRQGIESGRSAVNRSMSSLVETPAPGQWAVDARAQGTGRGLTPKVVRVGSDGTAFGDLMVKQLRKKVDQLGGNVQFVLGSGRG
ncbi:phage tail tape measure protein [Streptomyces sp. SAS_272]|uniref:phage tail tape measure protein n=1 Tax=Streptomyces sp. SAS_272 TaxID=3412747 RepID=UPI00403D4CBD